MKLKEKFRTYKLSEKYERDDGREIWVNFSSSARKLTVDYFWRKSLDERAYNTPVYLEIMFNPSIYTESAYTETYSTGYIIKLTVHKIQNTVLVSA